jgi:cyanobactin cluster PatC/TenC/TruC protein
MKKAQTSARQEPAPKAPEPAFEPPPAPAAVAPAAKPAALDPGLGRVTFSSGRPLPRTTGLDDFAFYSELFKDRTGENDPPFRRGRVWS